jgi:hypothetical protein
MINKKTLKIFQSKSNKDIHIIQKQQGMCESKSLFGIMIVVSFQSAFHLKIHQNNIFFIFKNSFLASIHQNDMKTTKKY